MKKVMVLYHSQEYGHTEMCARLVAQGLEESGVAVEMVNTNTVNRVDIAAMAACDGLAIGSPDYMSYVAGTIKQVFDDIYMAAKDGVEVKGKPCVLFMTHGGGGRGITALKSLAKNLNVIGEPFTCHRAPTEGCPEAIELGRRLAAAL